LTETQVQEETGDGMKKGKLVVQPMKVIEEELKCYLGKKMVYYIGACETILCNEGCTIKVGQLPPFAFYYNGYFTCFPLDEDWIGVY